MIICFLRTYIYWTYWTYRTHCTYSLCFSYFFFFSPNASEFPNLFYPLHILSFKNFLSAIFHPLLSAHLNTFSFHLSSDNPCPVYLSVSLLLCASSFTAPTPFSLYPLDRLLIPWCGLLFHLSSVPFFMPHFSSLLHLLYILYTPYLFRSPGSLLCLGHSFIHFLAAKE